jgi:hypothetical protein
MAMPISAPVRWLQEVDILDDVPVLTAFSCTVEETFEGIARGA